MAVSNPVAVSQAHIFHECNRLCAAATITNVVGKTKYARWDGWEEARKALRAVAANLTSVGLCNKRNKKSANIGKPTRVIRLKCPACMCPSTWGENPKRSPASRAPCWLSVSSRASQYIPNALRAGAMTMARLYATIGVVNWPSTAGPNRTGT